MRKLAGEASSILQKGRASVAVNCLSGRGRTGTFSAIILGKLLSVRTHSELVDVIVSMREHRDGLVETPAQFRFTASALYLPDPAQCNLACIASKSMNSITPSVFVPFFSGILFSIVLLLLYLVTTKSTLSSSAYLTSTEAKAHRYEQIKNFPARRDSESRNPESRKDIDDVLKMKRKSII